MKQSTGMICVLSFCVHMLLECQFKAVFSSPINHCPYTPIHTGSFNSSKVYFNTSKNCKVLYSCWWKCFNNNKPYYRCKP